MSKQPGGPKAADRVLRARNRLTGDVQDPVDVQEDARHGPAVSQSRARSADRTGSAHRDEHPIAHCISVLQKMLDVEHGFDLAAADVQA